MIDSIFIVCVVMLNILGLVIYDLVRYGRFLVDSIMTIPLPVDSYLESDTAGERVSFESLDGSELQGKLIKSDRNTGKTVIFCHEYGKSMNSWERYTSFLPKHGFNVLTLNFRSTSNINGDEASPSSKQWPSSLEYEDLMGAIHYLRSRPDLAANMIALFGISKGGGVAIYTASRSPEVKAVIVDGMYSMIELILTYAYRLAPVLIPKYVYAVLPKKIMFYFYATAILRVYGWKAGYNFLHVEGALQKNKNPVFFIHGEQDAYFRVKQVKMLFDRACGHKVFWTVGGAKHNEGVCVNPVEYEQRVVRFLEKYT